MKKLICILLGVMLLLACPLVSLASDEIIDSDDSYVGIVPYSSGSAVISRVSSTQVRIAGTSYAAKKTSLVIQCKLQYYVNGRWTDYPNSTTTVSGFGTSVSTSKTVTIKTGYQYRTYCTHAGDGSTNVSVSSSISM